MTALPQGQLAPAASVSAPLSAANARSDFNIGYCGYRFNGEIGTYTVRFRHYDPTPGMCRWLERDPAGYQDGPSLYSYLGRSPVDAMDPYGLLSRHAFDPRDPNIRNEFLARNGISRFESYGVRNGNHEVQPAVRDGREGWYLRRYDDEGHLVESRWVFSDVIKLACHADWWVANNETEIQRRVAGALLNSYLEQAVGNLDTGAQVAGTVVLLAVPGPEDLIIAGAVAKLARAESIAARGAVSYLGDAGKRAPEFAADRLHEDEVLDRALDYLGPGYREASPGRYISKDGRRQFRYGAHETRNPVMHHAHFEALDDAGRVIENSRVEIYR